MMNNKHLITVLTLLICIGFTSCDKDDPIIVDPPELITTLNYTLTPSNGGANVLLSFKDLDGDGGDDPTITGGTLMANETYSGTLELLNESISPSDDITLEIEEEDEEHQFFFQSDIADITFSYADQDPMGNPIGLSSSLVTGAAGSGSITITLRHEPMKSEAGVSEGDIANAGGETDIEVTFPIDVQ